VELSGDERLGLKTVAVGQFRSLPATVLEQLKLQQLIRFDGEAWVLTDDGHVVAYWSEALEVQRRKQL
jgi:hypothetical protein